MNDWSSTYRDADIDIIDNYDTHIQILCWTLLSLLSPASCISASPQYLLCSSWTSDPLAYQNGMPTLPPSPLAFSTSRTLYRQVCTHAPPRYSSNHYYCQIWSASQSPTRSNKCAATTRYKDLTETLISQWKTGQQCWLTAAHRLLTGTSGRRSLDGQWGSGQYLSTNLLLAWERYRKVVVYLYLFISHNKPTYSYHIYIH